MKMTDDTYVNKSRWHVLLPRKFQISKEMKVKWVYYSFEVVHTEMLLRMKTVAKHSFLTENNLRRQRTTHCLSLDEVEIHPILCPDAMTATCIPHSSSTHPTRQAFDRGGGGIN